MTRGYLFQQARDVLLRIEVLDTFAVQRTAICGHCGAAYTVGSQLEVRYFAEHVYACTGEANLIRFKETGSVKVVPREWQGFNYGLDA